MSAPVTNKRSRQDFEAQNPTSSTSLRQKKAPRLNNSLALYIQTETTGLKAEEHKTAEIALKILNRTGEVMREFSSFVKLSDRDWQEFSDSAQKTNGITREMTDKGETPNVISNHINQLLSTVGQQFTIYTLNAKFQKPFVAKVWPESNQYPWVDLGNLFKDGLKRGRFEGLHPFNFTNRGRNSMAQVLNMTKLPAPHSAMSSVNHSIVMHNRILRPNDTLPLYLMPVYNGEKRLREMAELWSVEEDSEATVTILAGEQLFAKGTEEWKAWKAGGLGSADAPVILGKTPPDWKTAQQLWREKSGKAEPAPLTEAQKRGGELEPFARAAFTRETGRNLRPACIQDTSDGWLRVSLDGITDDGKMIVDCICPGSNSYERARAGTLSPHTLWKLQAQLAACPTAEAAIAWVWDPDKGGLPIVVKPNREMQRTLRNEMNNFWGLVELDEEPLAPNLAPATQPSWWQSTKSWILGS